MTEKTVKQYRCDFCRKKLLMRPAMVRHEKSCTMNPDRVCGMCEAAGFNQVPIADLRALIPSSETLGISKKKMDQEETAAYTLVSTFTGDIDSILAHLEDRTEGCPACMLAALRQSGIPMSLFPGFNFKAARKVFWQDVNEMETVSDYLSIG